MHVAIPLMAPVSDAVDRPTTLVPEEVITSEQEAVAPMMEPTRDMLTTRDVAREVAEAAPSSSVAKPTDTASRLPIIPMLAHVLDSHTGPAAQKDSINASLRWLWHSDVFDRTSPVASEKAGE